MTREERVEASRSTIHRHYSDTQQEFLDFVLTHYIAQGVNELDPEKLPSLLELKYTSIHDALPMLGGAQEVREAFIGFQGYLYK